LNSRGQFRNATKAVLNNRIIYPYFHVKVWNRFKAWKRIKSQSQVLSTRVLKIVCRKPKKRTKIVGQFILMLHCQLLSSLILSFKKVLLNSNLIFHLCRTREFNWNHFRRKIKKMPMFLIEPQNYINSLLKKQKNKW
jgi:hypothetical protein